MYSLCVLSGLACLFCLLLTPIARMCAVRLGFLDHPDRTRKLHQAAVPRLGGVPILLAYAGSFLVLFALPMKAAGAIEANVSMIWRLLPAVGMVFFTGLADDLSGLSPWQKLLGQTAAVVAAFCAGVRIDSIAGHAMPTWCSLPLTLAWLLLCSNAFNLIDGIDGLATGVGLAATVTTMFAALLHGDAMLALATAPLAGCLLGFLPYNFNPASIFLGDSGSLLIGFLLGSYGIIWSQKSATMLGVAAPADGARFAPSRGVPFGGTPVSI